MSRDNARVEQSFGIVPLRKAAGEWHVLLIQHGKAKYWGFPKGHAEAGESPKETALRELKEETNLDVTGFLSDSLIEEHYQFTSRGQIVNKTVWFFVAEVQGTLILQETELSDAKWVSLKEAHNYLTHESDKTILSTAQHLI